MRPLTEADMSYIKLGFAALLPVFTAVFLYLLDKKTVFGKINKNVKQVIYGLIFGALAVLGTEYGIPMNGAQVNCRDAAVLIGGLFFGAPAGIIAGVIGGVERWIAVAWGIGAFTRVACSVSTLIAGIYAAALRKYMFEDKKPGWILSFAIGVVMEVFHLTMVFVTNMGTPEKAMDVVRACTMPMLIANGISVMIAAMALTIVAKERSLPQYGIRISQTVQKWLMITVLCAFAVTSFFVFTLQNEMATAQTDSLLTLALDETVADIRDTSNQNILGVARKVKREAYSADLNSLLKRYDVAEINLIDKNGVIYSSTVKDYIGFDMSSGEQSKEFLCLLNGSEEYVQDYGPISFDNSVMRKYAGVKTSNGFVQVGYDIDNFKDDIYDSVVGITNNRHVGQTGYVVIADENGEVVSCPKEEITKKELFKSGSFLIKAVDETKKIDLNSETAYGRYRLAESYYILSVLPEAEALQMRNVALYVNTFLEILVFAVLFAMIYLLIKNVVVNQIMNINNSLAKISCGDLNEVVNVRTNQEFASLSDDINTTVNTLKRYISDASARIDQELEFAQNIQKSALPSTFPAYPKHIEFDIFASMNPAKEVGGDFYDFYLTNNNVLNFLIADVSGKGIPAAMFMMRAKTELKSLTEAGMQIDDVFTHGNAALCEGNDAGMFVTAWQGGIDLKTGLVRYANAGHNPALVRHGDGKFEYVRSKVGFVLAGMDGVMYKAQELTLEPGDCIYLYTDGVTEATNANNELYGEERLHHAINAKEFESMQELCKYVKADVDKFVGDAPQFDDITMVALRYYGELKRPMIHIDDARIEDITTVTEFVENELEKIGCSMKVITQINIAVDEIFSNIVKYGYAGTSGPITVKIIEKENPNRVLIRFSDKGVPYNPLVKEDPDITLSAEKRSIGGLGIYLVKKTMDDVKYKYEDDENVLTITKKF